MNKHSKILALLAVSLLAVGPADAAVLRPVEATKPTAAKPTIVLVHGAMADSSSWSGVVSRLQADGYHVVAAANPLRSLDGDADAVARLIGSLSMPVVLVGHSYGGMVITNAVKSGNVRALVYVAAFAPDRGESSFDLVGKYPGSKLGASLAKPVPLADGANDLSVDPAKFRAPFAADLSPARAAVLASEQRPVTDVALKAGSGAPAWKTLPSWFVYGSADASIPPATQAFMAKRAGSRETVVVPGASHVVMISHPDAVAKVIEDAARGVSR